jgi:hypothetical protein
MQGSEWSRFKISIEWQWMVVTYCLFVLFVLFPSYLGGDLAGLFRLHGHWWTFFEKGVGVAVVSGYVGFRSKRITIVEPGIASVLYVTSLFFLLPSIWPRDFYYRVIATPWLVAFLVLALLAGCLGAAVGEWLQLRREKSN